ncbi:DNA cytosine methyltransferase [Anaerotruncus sp. 1XD42-93]|uniref:DNA cytosine methyltransferase n=1 Tax=Anaerotruncus sp. 1XD42-93 TaxID=2320853 RepID=UPI000EA09807|nr:DNA cytosine methyltransferase [Anaerotruncus sp. 1XD42-93]NBK20053.1 DNA (cytosine-5-)-methyltransferase [Anaerotruncus sp. 1XD42-93]RKJ75445.1 DNA (cytosine-5-)-methyltransferase [Anaerotruncus sp. 1XD22-93]
MKTDQLTLGSLFDGIGGFPYAASFYGIRPLWASEIVPECVSVTKKHFPDMEHFGDITKLHGGKLPPVDIITFGSPCQDLSVASGKRLGLAGERSGLFLEAIRIIREMQEATNGEYPKFALWENVPGALSSSSRRDFKAVLEAFTDAEVPMPGSGRWANAGMVRGRGVDLAWCVYDAQYFGTAQRRRRIFLIADLRGERAGEILFVPKSLSGYFAAGGTPRQGLAAYAQNGAGTAGAGDVIPAVSMRIRCGCEGGGKGPLLQVEKSGTLATGNDQYLFAPKVEILNDQGGDSLNVEKGGVSPTLRSQTHGNLPITAYAIQGSMIGRADGNGPQGDGINENVSFTLNTIDRHAVCMGTGQANAGILEEQSPTLTAAHEQPIVTHPQIAGTLCASGAGLSRPAGQGNELDFCVVSAGFKHKAGSQSGSIGFQEETAPTLLAGQQSAVMKAYVIGAYHSGGMLSDNPKSGFYEADTSRTLDLSGGNPCCNQGGVAVVEDADGAAAVDCRNLRETDEVSGTLLAKAASGGYSLNYQNPVRTGLCVRRLTPTEAERLQGYPDGWTEAGADGRVISDTKRYQMLGNSVAVPCVAYIMQGIRDAVGGE